MQYSMCTWNSTCMLVLYHFFPANIFASFGGSFQFQEYSPYPQGDLQLFPGTRPNAEVAVLGLLYYGAVGMDRP